MSIVTPESALSEVLKVFRLFLHYDDTDAIEVALGTFAANRLRGDPVWLMLVGPPSGGKGEILNTLTGLPHIYSAATLTEAALISGVSKKNRSKDAPGGLLIEMGKFGILLLKDFTSTLSMQRDERNTMLAALREIYDGAWQRRLGTDGGKLIAWQGKMGLIAGVTEALDSHHSVMAEMGPRFLLYRLPPIDAAEQARSALNQAGRESSMRDHLREYVSDLFSSLEETIADAEPPEASDADKEWLILLTVFATRCRSAVERDPYKRHIVNVPQPEAPARLARSAAQLLAGLSVIGVPHQRCRELVRKCLLDCIPPVRRRALEYLARASGDAAVSDIARAVGLPEQTMRTALEDLGCHRVVMQPPSGKGWKIAPAWRGHVRKAFDDL